MDRKQAKKERTAAEVVRMRATVPLLCRTFNRVRGIMIWSGRAFRSMKMKVQPIP